MGHYEGYAHGKVIVNLEHCNTATKRSSDYEQEIFKLGSKNIGTLRADQVTLWRHNAEKWSIFAASKNSNGKEHQQRQRLWKIISKTFFWLVIIPVIHIEKKWTEKVIEVKRVSEWLLMVKLQTDKRTASVVFAYTPHQDLGNDKKAF